MSAFDDNTVRIVSIIAPVVSTIVLGILAYFTALANINAQAAAHKADMNATAGLKAAVEVKQTLADSTATTAQKLDDHGAQLEDIAVTAHNTQRMGEATHTLVNHDRGVLLTVNAHALRRLADLSLDKQDEEIAKEAERVLAQHMAAQAVVDSRPSPEATESGHAGGA
jgi:hypothetical protein